MRQATVSVRNNPHNQELIALLEEYITDDVSGTDGNNWVRVSETVPGRVLEVAVSYDGVSHQEYVEGVWVQLAGSFLTPEDVASIAREHARQSRLGENPIRRATRERAENDALVGSRRRRMAAQREREEEPAPEPFAIRWADTEVWRTPETEVPILTMPEQFLWATLIWIVRSKEVLCEQAGALVGKSPPALTACCWLRDQPLFRSLLKESIKRCLTYPSDVHAYFKQYVLDRHGTLDGYVPWQDPNLSYQAEEMRPFLSESTVPPEQAVAKELRKFTFTDA